MNLKTALVSTVLVLLTNSSVAQGQFEHCNEYLRYGAQQVAREYSTLHETALNYSLYCRLDSQEMSETEVIKAGGSIPGVGSGSGSRDISRMRAALSNWCDEKRNSDEMTEIRQSEAISASRVGQEAWNNCQEAAQNKVVVRLLNSSDDSTFLHFEIDSTLDAPIFLNDVVQRNFSCHISHRVGSRRAGIDAALESTGSYEILKPGSELEIGSENV